MKAASGVIVGSCVAEHCAPMLTAFAEEPRPAIADIALDLHRLNKWDDSNGDTWDPFWADDNSLYAFNCDGRGFGSNPMNLAFNKLAGETADGLIGTQVNAMAEYGKAGQKEPDNATWKACGQECIDGVFYAFVSRNIYGSDSHDPLTRQLAVNSSLIKSTDRGLTWTRNARENYDHPMWPGSHFGAPFFVHYGRNGGQINQDGANNYVYACSTNGFWNDGDSLILARVKRSLLSRLDSHDWEYLSGHDGSSASNWSHDVLRAVPILERPAKCGQGPITFVSELGLYLLVSWYNTETMTKWFEPNRMRYDFYQAPHPWGPWTLAGTHDDSFLGPVWHMYGPSICARFQKRRGDDVEVSLFTSGCPFEDVRISPYKMWRIPLILRKKPLPPSRWIAASDPEIHYKGAWFPFTTIEEQQDDRLPRAAQSKGAWAELSFTGTGIEYIAEKTTGLGDVDIFVDHEHRATSSLALEDFPVLFGAAVFSVQQLAGGSHTIRVVSSTDLHINVEGFRVYA
ncbi:MAG TPA: hypothetical protein VHX20_14755 [Terracidiphilus sp.]|jgi:hypothetical protein|nr:hypothetical protein [Terracidiphilus sp.]